MSDLKNLMISVSGVRGIVGDGLTPEVAMKFAQAYGSEMGPGTIVVGRDSRATGEMIKYAVCAGLMSVGCNVVDLGICSTPTTELVTEKPEHAGGIIITASHNPREWNALKLLAANGLFLTAEAGDKILRRVNNNDFNFAAWDKMGKVNQYDAAVPEHIAKILDLPLIDAQLIRGKKFKIVVDSCNGAGGTVVPQLLAELGCEVVHLNPEPNGFFPRNPEPIPANLGELSAAVKQNGADLGVAVDPDVDRLALVSEKGEPLGEEYTLACVTRYILTKTPGDVVVNASTSRMVDDAAGDAGVKVYRSKVGEINVAVMAQEIDAVICGEGNGGVMYPAIHIGRDAPVGIALVLQYMAESGAAISELYGQIPHYVMIKDKIELPFDADAKGVVKQLETMHAGENLDLIDGLKVLYDNSWVHIRASNTEPIIRVIAESPAQAETEALVEQFKTKVREITG